MATPATEKFQRYRGELRAVLGAGSSLLFVTVHPEGQGTALWRLEVDKAELDAASLPGGATALAADADSVYVAGTDGRLYRAPLGGGPAKPVGEALGPAPHALAILSGERLAALCGPTVHIVSRRDGRVLQSLPLPEPGTALAADPGGNWLVAGTAQGTLVVLDCEEKERFLAGESAKLHEGAVTALLFEPQELRVLSAGVDNRLLSTHVRGKLEPEDRGGKSGHEAPIRAIVSGGAGLFYTGASDAAVKAWPWEGKGRPTTIKDGVAPVTAMTLVQHKGRPHLALACEDATLRLLQLDAAGKVGQHALLFRDAYAWARHEMEQPDLRRREVALRALATYLDAPAVELLAERAAQDPDHTLKVLAAELLGGTGLTRAVKPLEGLLKAPQEAVRKAALAGLRAIEGEASLRPLELALQTRKPDVGVQAVQALGELARTDELALARLVQSLDEPAAEVRAEALRRIEALYPEDSAEADLVGLRSSAAPTRSLALTRLYQRQLLGLPEAAPAVRRHLEDDDADVRQSAFLVSLTTRPRLAQALRERDADVQRHLTEMEGSGSEKAPREGAAAKPARGKRGKSGTPAEAGALEEADYEPLLQAMACRALDTCLRGATGLARLKDERAFGTLLQLSREKDNPTRVATCKALQELGDPRGVQRLRLMLRDAAPEVRDATFTALASLEGSAPLRAAEAGLAAEHEDVRRRGLQLAVAQLRKAPEDQAAQRLLERALNDGFPGVRSEALKAALNLGVGGGGAATLRFALQSLHADVRRDVLVEVMAQVGESWAWSLLLELFGDPDPGIRAEAFELANKKSSGRALEPLAAALRGRHADLRTKAAEALAKRKEPGARDLLVNALDDEERAVRQLAVGALLVAGESDALIQALGSRHADVRGRAAVARAVEGDSAALEPLLGLAAEKEPGPEATAEARQAWAERVVLALQGLAEMGDPRAQEPVALLLESKEARIRVAAAGALGWISQPGAVEPLRAALQHADEAVRLTSAFGLALCGDPSGASLLLTARAASAGPARQAEAPARPGIAALSQAEQRLQQTGGKPAGSDTAWAQERALLTALALREHAADPFLAFLDHPSGSIRGRAVLLLLLQELGAGGGRPDRLLAALSSAFPRVRLDAARALETVADRKAFEALVVELLNDQGEGKLAWKVPSETVRTLAEVVGQGDPRLRVRAARLLAALEAEKQETFERAWRIFSIRFARQIAALEAAAKKRKPDAAASSPEEIGRLVFGAYVGLSRQAGGAAEVRIRETAVARLLAAARASEALRGPVRQVLLLGLGDPNGVVRKQAFDGLKTLGLDPAALAAETLASGERDMAALGLKLITESVEEAEAVPALERVLLERTDGLEEEAAKVLAERAGWAPVWKRGLEARSEGFREASVAGLARLYEESADAKAALHEALRSRYRHVRSRAARELAQKKDSVAFDGLRELLRSDVANEQRQGIAALTTLGDPRVPGAFLDRIDRDPAGTAQHDGLLREAASFRSTEVVPRLLGYLTDKKLRAGAFQAVLTISGFDQPVPDWDAETPAAWETKQHPRRSDVLAQLMQAAHRLADDGLLGRLTSAARWSRGPEVAAPLAALTSYPKPEVRHAALEALGWRLRKRKGPAEPLVQALVLPDPKTQFLAAEGLALGARHEGLGVLLSGVELLDDIVLRKRAVKALGELADPRALDLLLRLVNEDGHALQEQAAEAIGHMRRPEKAEVIFKRLAALAKGPATGLAVHALTGLRWLDTRDAWALIRESANAPEPALRLRAAELLGSNDDPATRDLLARLLTDPKWANRLAAAAAAKSLRKLFGPDSLEPDYIFAQCEQRNLEPDTLERLSQKGDSGRLLELLAKIPERNEESVRRPLILSLLSRSPLPVEEAARFLEGPDPHTAEVAAQVLGRAGKSMAKRHGTALVQGTARARREWHELNARLQQVPEPDPGQEARRAGLEEWWCRALWACGRLEVGAEELLAAAGLAGAGDGPRAIRAAALTALAGGVAGPAGIEALEQAVFGADASCRTVAATALRKLAPERAAALLPRALDDRALLDRLVEDVAAGAGAEALRGAAANPHQQGAVLPHLVARADVDGLAAALQNCKIPEAARLGALEALARIGSEAAERPILEVARAQQEPEELRKAAWRALRRARRIRSRAKVKA
jgi:HEAT repeat protein